MSRPSRSIRRNLKVTALATSALIVLAFGLSYFISVNAARTTVFTEYGIINARTTTVSLTWGYLAHRYHIDERRPIDFVAIGQPIPQPAAWHISTDRAKEIVNSHSNWLGISQIATIGCGDRGSTTNGVTLVPLWLLLIVSALPFWAPPTARLLLRYRRSPEPGTCTVCGYDLRATPQRCPECGTSAAAVIDSEEPLILRR
jgi:hypothetical protein